LSVLYAWETQVPRESHRPVVYAIPKLSDNVVTH